MTHRLRQDVFTPTTPTGRMTRAQIDELAANPKIGAARTAMTLAHQSRAAVADGDLEHAAYIEQVAASLSPNR